ncbi:DNA-protecting protein DprA [Solimonas sp. K1W22B-7]|uniref:DNA-processing protein DprA n=1 Tax=Solimonas sp. K1W22B-7 TaxID=2303331 RepID=UPI000E332512|nr:DNA-processing protein DprA [Solimonas sp. K1W22B-7]AXQ31396.1 DNA-protecting protein DprA [Solimonas sp. K1W22B-7]
MNLPPLQSWLTLLRAPGIGGVAVARLVATFGSAEAALAASPMSLRPLGLGDETLQFFATGDPEGVALDLAWLERPGRSLLTLEDPRYPQRLREIASAPAALFCQGDPDLLALPQLAIVGARSATPQGLENARAFAAELARRGLCITSGLALGIDGAAHRGALEAGGMTIAVCATGLDRVYPARHRELAHDIVREGLMISEFPIGVPALPEHFPRRNRIISGLALGVLVVEAAPESGSLITARYANEQGREVFAIPGSIHNPQARGCHRLIRQGAKLVESIDDILEEIAPQLRQRRETLAASAAPEDPAQARLLECLGTEPQSFDQLQAACGLDAAAFGEALLALELSGEVAAAAGGAYQRLRVPA